MAASHLTSASSQARIHYDRWGTTGPRVLLIHPIGFDHRTWDRVVPLLEGSAQMIALDLPGHGRSEKLPGADYGLHSLGARVIRFLDEVGWEDAVLVGNSLGGGTSLSITLQAPGRVRGLVLINSVGFRQGLPLLGRLGGLPLLPLLAGYTPALAMRLGLGFARANWLSVPGDRFLTCQEYFREPEGRAAFFQTLRQLYGPDLDRMSPLYGEIRCPTLILHGERDPLIRMAHAERMAATIPDARLVRIPRCGHFPPEETPEIVADELRGFLRELSIAANASDSSVVKRNA